MTLWAVFASGSQLDAIDTQCVCDHKQGTRKRASDAAKRSMRIAITGAARTLLRAQPALKALRHDAGVILDFSQSRDTFCCNAKRLALRAGAYSAP